MGERLLLLQQIMQFFAVTPLQWLSSAKNTVTRALRRRYFVTG
jgi:hypothetical protein